MPDLKQSIEIKAPIEKVWAEITKLRDKQRWQIDTILESSMQPGDPLFYKSEDGKRTFVVGRVVEVVEPTRFAHTFVLTVRNDEPTLVVWELEARGAESTRVLLTHTGWKPDVKNLNRVDKTWAGIVAGLKTVMETGNIGIGDRVKYLFMRPFMFALPARTKTERVVVPDWMPEDTPR